MDSKIHTMIMSSILAFSLIAGIPTVFAQNDTGMTSGGGDMGMAQSNMTQAQGGEMGMSQGQGEDGGDGGDKDGGDGGDKDDGDGGDKDDGDGGDKDKDN